MTSSKLQTLKDNREDILLAEVGALLHDVGKISDGFLLFHDRQMLWAKYHHLVMRRLANNVTIVPNLTAVDIQNGIVNASNCIQHNQFDESKLVKVIRQSGQISKKQAEVILGEAVIKNNLFSSEMHDLLEITNMTLIGEQLVIGDVIEEHSTPFYSRTSGIKNDRKKASLLIQHSDWCDSNADKGSANSPQKTGTFISSAFGYESRAISQNNLNLSNDIVTNWQNYYDVNHIIREVFNKTLGETRRSANDVTLWDHSYSVASLFKSAIAKVIIDGWLEPTEIIWHILRVNFDVLDLYSRAIKIADLLAYRQAIDDACEAVKELVEYEYLLGNEVYRDTTGIYFIFPDIDLPAELSQEIRHRVEEIDMELAPRIAVGTGQGTTAAEQLTMAAEQLKQILAEQRSAGRKELAQPFSTDVLGSCWNELWDNLPDGKWEVCPICRLRPMKEHGEACEHCLKRRESRVEIWKENPTKTIWMDEIADQNDRVALLVGKFGLADWLTGDLVQTMLIRCDPGNTDPDKRFVPKNSSPARLRRIWETCQQFWDDSVISIFQDLLPDRPRCELIPQMPLRSDEPPKETVCDGTLNGQPISVFRIGDRLLTISFVEEPKEGTLSISWETYGCKKAANIDIVEAMKAEGELSEYRCYAPFLPLLSSPDQFLALIPASDALAITEKVRKEYIEQFSKVQNRLPLFLGLVFFQRKVPLMAVMNTARRMLAMPQGSAQVNISKNLKRINIDADGWPKEVRVPIRIKDEIVMKTVMGDDQTPDVWYPYWRVDGKPTNRDRYFVGFDNEHWVHINDLKENDEVQIYPSSFAYIFLENTAQRFAFDPYKDIMLLDELQKLRKMWNKICNTLDMTNTKIQKIWSLLETKWVMWGLNEDSYPDYQERLDTFRQLAETALKRDKLIQKGRIAVSVDDVETGRFRRCLELHLKILKLSVKGGQHEQQPKTA